MLTPNEGPSFSSFFGTLANAIPGPTWLDWVTVPAFCLIAAALMAYNATQGGR